MKYKKKYLTWLHDLFLCVSSSMFGDTCEGVPVVPILFLHVNLTDSSVKVALHGRWVLNEARKRDVILFPDVFQGRWSEVGGQTAETDHVLGPRSALYQWKHRRGFRGR